MRVIVVGCGVSGLSSGIRLLEAGYSVEIWARELPPHTTSDVAAAVWYPYLAFPQERVNAWSRRTFEVLRALERTDRGVGVRTFPGVEVFRAPVADPWWKDSVPDFRRAAPEELPPEDTDGYVFSAPVIEMPRYLPYLMGRFGALGGRIERREVRSLEEPLAQASVVVNCTGLGSRELVDDTSMYPIRGEVLRVEPSPVERFLLDEDEARGMAYVIPRGTDCILGGTAERGNESLVPDPEQARGILARTSRLMGADAKYRVVEHRVGLRPGRPSVRLEVERVGAGRVVHNYGHGGAGVTLSWGCAEEVVALVGGSGG
ncbi:FAD-dependent oxidoreductase [Myxococcaceae bacterium GXIMD 01537]